MKTEIYNLIILDESGSMCPVHQQTIDGCNETINSIKSSQKKFGANQDHYVSIYAFQSGGMLPSRYIIKNRPAADVVPITSADYQPDGCTPLYDAIGATLTDLKATINTRPSAIGSVTIITDGAENSSEQYTREKVAKMISQLKELGWNFNFIGANIDVVRTASALNIDNTLEFKHDAEGTREMFAKERRSREAYNARVNEAMCSMPMQDDAADIQVRRSKLAEAARGYFDL